MPKGAIILWSGQSIPTGFHLCDGSNVQGFGVVPDLRGRFVIGQDPTKASTPGNATDLSENYGKIGNTGGQKAVGLSTGQLPAHNHVSDSRFNKLSARAADLPDKTGTVASIDSQGNDYEYRIAYMDRIAGLWDAATIASVGQNQQHENRPPYYVLAYIIKVV
jgi:microcystin-dependent protein